MGRLEVDTDVSTPNLVLSHSKPPSTKTHCFGRFDPVGFHSLHWQQDAGVWLCLDLASALGCLPLLVRLLGLLLVFLQVLAFGSQGLQKKTDFGYSKIGRYKGKQKRSWPSNMVNI